MSKLRIVYATKTRHSKKLAQAIGNALNTPVENVSDNLLSGEADLLFLWEVFTEVKVCRSF